MDTSSTVACCVDLLQDIATLLSAVQHFVANFKAAERDLRSLPSDLSSLRLSVRAIEASCSLSTCLPLSLKENLRSVLTGCSQVVKNMHECLVDFPASQPDRDSRWALKSRPKMAQLMTNLEAHKSAIQIALELLLIMNPEADSSQQRLQSTGGRHVLREQQTTDQIFMMLREIRVLQFQVAQLARVQAPSSSSIHHFLDDVSDYAGSVYQESEVDSFRVRAMQEPENESELEDFYSAKESFVDSTRPSTQAEPESTDHFELMVIDLPGGAPNQPDHSAQGLPNSLPTLLPSSSSTGEHSAWSYTSIRLRISNRLYSFKTADDTARNVMSAISFLDPAIRAVRLARQQGVIPLSDAQKTWIDQQITFAEQSMDRAALLVEPARIDLQKRSRVRFARKISFVLRDSPRISACFNQLSVAGSGLNKAASILYGNSDVALRSPRDGEDDSISGMSMPAPPYSLAGTNGIVYY